MFFFFLRFSYLVARQRVLEREERALSSICSEVEQPGLEPALLWDASIRVEA